MTGEEGALPRVKPFKYTYEKEIVMYAYYKKLDYFSTECVYAPFAARGAARDFVQGPRGVPWACMSCPALISQSGGHCVACCNVRHACPQLLRTACKVGCKANCAASQLRRLVKKPSLFRCTCKAGHEEKSQAPLYLRCE